MKSILGKCNGKGLDKVGVIVNNTYLELTQKEEIEFTYHKENRKKFLQTRGTPAITRQLARELDFIRDSEACKQILDRVYQALAGTDEYTLDYLETLQ